MPKCCVAGCSKRTDDAREGISKPSFHKFPSRITRSVLHDRWLVNIAREAFTPTCASRICSEHFEDHCFTYKKRPLNDEEKRTFMKNILLDDAVPTIFPDRPEKFPRADTDRYRRLQRRRTQQVIGGDSDECHDM